MTRPAARLVAGVLPALALIAATALPAHADDPPPGPASILLESVIRAPEGRASAYDESIVRDGPVPRSQVPGRPGLSGEIYIKESCPEPTHWRLEPPPLPGRRTRQ